jgi:hypothetical protein
MTNPPNPKDKFGKEKPSLQYIPMLPLLEEAVVMRGGCERYGYHNWREQPVEAMTYVSAAFRHLIFWVCGQEDDLESLVSHLAHMRACAGIIRDAQLHGTLIDNRPPPTDPTVLLEFFEKLLSAPHFERKIDDGDRAEKLHREKTEAAHQALERAALAKLRELTEEDRTSGAERQREQGKDAYDRLQELARGNPADQLRPEEFLERFGR